MTDNTNRYAELRSILNERQREVPQDVQRRIRDGRADRMTDVRGGLERTDAISQGDIDMALLQMRSETLIRIEQALARLDAGEYGRCSECDDEISERRLRALPFAARCQECEGRREQAEGHARQRTQGQQRADLPLFHEAAGF